MEYYLSDYGIDKEQLKQRLTEANAIIAGSFALVCFLRSKDIDPGFQPNDIDIWISSRGYGWPLERFIKESGFVRSNKFDRQNTYNHRNSSISSVVSYIKDNMEIQIITINDIDALDHIKKCFDLTCCISWWDLGSNKILNIEPEITIKKEMKLLIRNDKTCSRVIKYKNRGFELIENIKKDRFTKLLPVYDFYCNVRGFDTDKDRKYYKPKILKTYNASILIQKSFYNSQVNPNTDFGMIKMYENIMEFA